MRDSEPAFALLAGPRQSRQAGSGRPLGPPGTRPTVCAESPRSKSLAYLETVNSLRHRIYTSLSIYLRTAERPGTGGDPPKHYNRPSAVRTSTLDFLLCKSALFAGAILQLSFTLAHAKPDAIFKT
jgi:hypothetical protein